MMYLFKCYDLLLHRRDDINPKCLEPLLGFYLFLERPSFRTFGNEGIGDSNFTRKTTIQ